MHLLLKRNPTIFYQHFIECIFHFTGYEKHESFNRFPQSDRSVPRRGWCGGPGGSITTRHGGPWRVAQGREGVQPRRGAVLRRSCSVPERSGSSP